MRGTSLGRRMKEAGHVQRGHGDTGDVERPPSPASCPRDLLPVALVTVRNTGLLLLS